MRIIQVIMILSLLVGGAATVVAQEQSEVVAFNRLITSVVDSPFGFKITYRHGAFEQREMYIPTDWIFRDKVALVSYSRNTSVPYLQMYFDANTQDLAFIRVVLPKSPEHLTWNKTYDDDLEQKFSEAQFGSL